METSRNAALFAVLCAVLTTMIWAGNAIMARGLGADLPPVGLAFWRWLLACVVFLPFAIRPLLRDRKVIRANLPILLALAIPGVSYYNTFVYIALQTSPVANTTMVICGTPALILLFSNLLFKDPIRKRDWLGIALSILGVCVLLTKGDLLQLERVSIGQGEIWALAAAVSWAIYSVLLKKRPEGVGQRSFVLFTFTVGMLSLLPFAIYEHYHIKPMEFTQTNILAILYVGLFASILAYLMWNNAVKVLGPSKVGILLYMFPVFAVVGAAIILGEGLELFHFIGIFTVLSGVAILLIKRAKPA
ncbi:DMT family transporter [Curvivirga sp.]|uniref:DMT family transporter n=1 Tax=Curvivirga sp. TaxID=2856848 RepID=UPI003B5CF2B0